MTIARDKRDPLALDLPERRVIIGEDGKVKSIAFRDRLESMRVIEELMIQANVAAAESLEKAKMPLLYRIHETPSKEKLFAFSDYLRTIGMSFAKGQVVKPGTFNRILAQAKVTPHAEIMNDVVLRTQAQAVYAPDNIGHFELDSALRPLHLADPALCRFGRAPRIDPRAPSGLRRIERQRNRQAPRNRRSHIHVRAPAMAAERNSTERYVAAFMKEREGATFAVRVTGVTRFGLFVRLKETGAEGLIAASTLGQEYSTRRKASRADRRPLRHDLLPRRYAGRPPRRGRAAHRRLTFRTDGRQRPHEDGKIAAAISHRAQYAAKAIASP